MTRGPHRRRKPLSKPGLVPDRPLGWAPSASGATAARPNSGTGVAPGHLPHVLCCHVIVSGPVGRRISPTDSAPLSTVLWRQGYDTLYPLHNPLRVGQASAASSSSNSSAAGVPSGAP